MGVIPVLRCAPDLVLTLLTQSGSVARRPAPGGRAVRGRSFEDTN